MMHMLGMMAKEIYWVKWCITYLDNVDVWMVLLLSIRQYTVFLSLRLPQGSAYVWMSVPLCSWSIDVEPTA